MIEKIDEAVAWILERSAIRPRIGMILGSGLGDFVDSVEIEFSAPYADIPHAPVSGVAGHTGRLCLGRVADTAVAIMQGRVHYYEGWDLPEVIFMPRVLGRLGIETAIVTNAAGGANRDFEVGDLMLIADHFNLMGENPLRGLNIDELGVRFPDMSNAYPEALRSIAKEVGTALNIRLREGVYLALSGPSYETPAEIRAFRTLGADAIGMSTVPEVIALSQMGIPVLGISCITNMAAGILPQPLTHQEVIDTTARVAREFADLMLGVVERVGERLTPSETSRT